MICAKSPPLHHMREENIEVPDGTTIYKPENVKYQGVWLDNKFSFTQHIDLLTCKIGHRWNAMEKPPS